MHAGRPPCNPITLLTTGLLVCRVNMVRMLGGGEKKRGFWREKWFATVVGVLECLQSEGLKYVTDRDNKQALTILNMVKEVMAFTVHTEPNEQRKVQSAVE